MVVEILRKSFLAWLLPFWSQFTTNCWFTSLAPNTSFLHSNISNRYRNITQNWTFSCTTGFGPNAMHLWIHLQISEYLLFISSLSQCIRIVWNHKGKYTARDSQLTSIITRQSEMADLARRATRWVGTFPYILTPIPNLYDHSFPRYGQITFLTFRRPTTLTFDLKFWKYLSVTVYPYVICMPSFIMIGWEMAEILHFEILRKHGQTNTQTHKHTNKQTHEQTWALQYLALPLWGAR